jgi:hypothetical protein
MFGLIALGAAVVVIATLNREEEKAKNRWHNAQYEQRRVLAHENTRLQRQLAHAQQRLQREEVRQNYHISIALGNDAHALLNDAKLVLNGLHRQLAELKTQRTQVQQQLDGLRQQGDQVGVRQCIDTLKAIHAARQAAFVERDRIKAEKEALLEEVHTINARTRELRQQLEGLGWVRPSARIRA